MRGIRKNLFREGGYGHFLELHNILLHDYETSKNVEEYKKCTNVTV